MPAAIQQPCLLSPVTAEDLTHLQFHLPSVKVISYTGPGQSGGVSLSLEPVVKQLGAKVDWIALSGLPDADRSPIPGFSFHKPTISSSLMAGHAQACLEYLWPLMHGMSDRAVFSTNAWKSFRQLSGIVAAEVLSLSAQSFPTLCWLHDYHMALIAPLVALESGMIPCHFWHVPWPEPEIMLASPVVAELVTPMMANKLVGFHTSEYATNFLNTVQEVIPESVVDMLNMTIRIKTSTTRIVVMPLGLDFAHWQRIAKTSRPASSAIPKRFGLASQLILGIDRLDYTKGIIEKLNGLEAFLANNPHWHRRFHYLQLVQPPQAQTRHFQEYVELVGAKVQSINHSFHINGWEPIVLLNGELEHKDLAAWYQAADVLLVTPIRDGLNLIAKEYVACRQDEQGVLILSRKAGSADELSGGALLVDPLKSKEIADSIARALSMGPEEKRRRMHSMRHVVSWNQLHDWALGFLRQAILTTT